MVSRTTPLNPDDPEDYITAWNISTSRRPLEKEDSGSEFILRIESFSSVRMLGCIDDTRTWRGGVEWYDEAENLLSTTVCLYRSEPEAGETTYYGVIPEGAAFYEIRIGFDIPDVSPGDYTVVRSVALETLAPATTHYTKGNFTSGVLEGGKFSWDASIPQGCSLKFQISTLMKENGVVDEFSDFVGPDGTSSTFFDKPWQIDAPFFRYRVFLESNGKETPTLKSVCVGDYIESSWKLGGDSIPPLVKIVGKHAAPTTDGKAPLSLEIFDPSFVVDSSVKISIDGEDVTSRFTRCKSKDKVGASIWTGDSELTFNDGLHKVVVESSDIMKNTVTSTRSFLIGPEPTAEKVTIREDGLTLIGGKPFFPIGIFGLTKREEYNDNSFDVAFRQLKDAGFNFAHAYFNARTDEFLSTAEKFGFKVWLPSGLPDDRFVNVERNSPAVLAWYLGDDTAVHMTPSQLHDSFYSVKAVDPARITVQADCVTVVDRISSYSRYITGTDAFMPEIYSYDGHGASIDDACVAKIIHDVDQCRVDIENAHDGPKAIWPIVQCFDGWWVRQFAPYQELRAMSFATLAADANGVLWFFYCGTKEEEAQNKKGAITSPERWNELAKITKQINELTPVLVKQTQKEQQPAVTILNGEKKNPIDGDTVACVLKRHDDACYLIAVNTSPKPCEVRFDVPNKPQFKDFQTLFDEKDKDAPLLQDGSIVEKLEKFGVRVYYWKDN